jgi:hypothetical protein
LCRPRLCRSRGAGGPPRPSSDLPRLRKWPSALCGAGMTRRRQKDGPPGSDARAALGRLGTSSEFRWAVARRAVKVDAVLGFENPKAFGNAIRLHFYIMQATDLRKLCSPGFFAPRAPKNFNPMVVSGHPANMRRWMAGSIRYCPGFEALATARFKPALPPQSNRSRGGLLGSPKSRRSCPAAASL